MDQGPQIWDAFMEWLILFGKDFAKVLWLGVAGGILGLQHSRRKKHWKLGAFLGTLGHLDDLWEISGSQVREVRKANMENRIWKSDGWQVAELGGSNYVIVMVLE